MTSGNSNKTLGSFALCMISVSAIINLREFPMMATTGLQSLFYFGLALILFLVPSALVCAELATMLPENGGIYTWVRTAFGQSAGFLTIWMEWLNNLISFPATLATLVATVAYVFMPGLEQHKWMLFIVMMSIFWGLTFFNCLGIETTSRLNIVGAIVGTMLPSLIIMALGITWFVTGHPIALNANQHRIIPSMHAGPLSFFVGVLSSYAGMQITAFHAQNVKNPKRSFPRAIAAATLIIGFISIAVTLAIAFVVPANKISFLSGVISAFDQYFHAFHITALTPMLVACIALASLASLNAWIIGPVRGLQNAAEHGCLPRLFAQSNRNGMPQQTLMLQGVIGSLLGSIFLFAPTLKTAFWSLIILTSQFTVFVFILVFAAAIKLRYSHPQLARPYRIPGNNAIMWLVCAAAITACVASFIFGLFPPKQLHIAHPSIFTLWMLAGDIVLISMPLIWLWWRRPIPLSQTS